MIVLCSDFERSIEPIANESLAMIALNLRSDELDYNS